jgi:hypothetical protein
MSSSDHECHGHWCHRIIVVEQGVCFTLRVYDLQHEGPHGGLSIEGERSFMTEDTPAPFELGLRRCVMGTVRGTVPGEVYF